VTVRARRIGFAPGEIAINVEAASVTVPIVMRVASTPTLDTMRVVGARIVSGRLDEFEARRRNHQATVSITREEIEKRNPVESWQMLRGIAGVTVATRDYKVVATSRRAMISRFDNAPCFLLVMVDGVPLSKVGTESGFNLQELPPPDQIHGIEVFVGPASIPLQYGGTGNGKWCGLIAIWTR
jgi:outer membrane receptor for ferrienterochelin and colicin